MCLSSLAQWHIAHTTYTNVICIQISSVPFLYATHSTNCACFLSVCVLNHRIPNGMVLLTSQICCRRASSTSSSLALLSSIAKTSCHRPTMSHTFKCIHSHVPCEYGEESVQRDNLKASRVFGALFRLYRHRYIYE